MTDSHVLARKFRPQTFEQVVGQDAITRTLHNALKNNRVHHAYLFTGARGVGKTTTARIFAKALNCIKGLTDEPCGKCDSCLDIAASRSMDVLEIDAASNTGVDNVRDVIINSISIAPARDRHKIFIIDEVHMLSTAAFNALLKTVEEPPPRVVFILATTALEKVPETILSRCQVFEFRTITLTKIVEELRRISKVEGVTIGDAALLAIARAGEGSMRDAESALDQVISFAVGNKVTDEDVSAALGLVDTETLNQTLQAIADQDPGQIVRIIDDVVSRGYELRNLCREMMVHIRALLVVKIAGFDTELVQLPESEAANLQALAERFSEQDLLRFFSILTKTEQDIKNSSQPRFQLEIGLVKLSQAGRLVLLEDALDRISALEARLGGGSPELSSSSQGFASAPKRSVKSPTSPASSVKPRETSPRPSADDEPASPRPRTPSRAAELTSSASSSATRATPARSAIQEPEPTIATASLLDTRAPEQPVLMSDPEPSVERSQKSPIDRIKDALEAKGKLRIIATLDKATITIDGDHLNVLFGADGASCKAEIEDRNRRIAIEDAAETALGRRLALKASISQAAPSPASAVQRKAKLKSAVENDVKLQALVDKFHGEVIEVIKPD
jgi:DNA polymerase III subunit gamma/tau